MHMIYESSIHANINLLSDTYVHTHIYTYIHTFISLFPASIWKIVFTKTTLLSLFRALLVIKDLLVSYTNKKGLKNYWRQ